ncbi:uncharacterized protein LOC123308795 [Coccinella septempunctata]|uniref:uncharacterized protein LOC123308795 n=1 Tax=Coccinella septempunctata TaxID=41139 RepID=UPI001D06A9D4|nr:uncharacterized protein LOC123308795 [Coccinella septempunctata]
MEPTILSVILSMDFPLHETCLHGTFESLKKMVKSGKFFIDCESPTGVTPMGIVAVRLYVYRPQDVDSRSVREYERKIIFLLQNGANPLKKWCGGTIADLIFQGGNQSMIHLMFKYFEDVDTPLNSFGHTALISAIRRGFYKTAEILLGLKADVNKGCGDTSPPCSFFWQSRCFPSTDETWGKHGVEERSGRNSSSFSLLPCGR